MADESELSETSVSNQGSPRQEPKEKENPNLSTYESSATSETSSMTSGARVAHAMGCQMARVAPAHPHPCVEVDDLDVTPRANQFRRAPVPAAAAEPWTEVQDQLILGFKQMKMSTAMIANTVGRSIEDINKRYTELVGRAAFSAAAVGPGAPIHDATALSSRPGNFMNRHAASHLS